MSESPASVLFDERGDPIGVSSFGEIRVVSPHLVANLINKYRIDPNEYGISTTGGGAVAHVATQSAIRLSVGATVGDKARLRTHTYFRYQAGRSLLVRQTGYAPDVGVAGQVRRWGFFDDNDGLFWELNGTAFRVAIRSSTSGSPLTTVVEQASWNVDKLDGTGQSGVTLDVTKGNIYQIQFQWLGVGNVDFYVNGIHVHRQAFVNTLAAPYMRTATLPLSWEVENVSAATAGSWTYICSAVAVEGGEDPAGYSFGTYNSVDISVGNTEIPLLSIRPALLFNAIENRGLVIPAFVTVSTEGARAGFRISVDGTLTGASWAAVGSESMVEWDEAATACVGGYTILRDFLPDSIDGKAASLTEFFQIAARALKRRAFLSESNVLTVLGVKEKSGGSPTLMRASLTWNEAR